MLTTKEFKQMWNKMTLESLKRRVESIPSRRNFMAQREYDRLEKQRSLDRLENGYYPRAFHGTIKEFFEEIVLSQFKDALDNAISRFRRSLN